MRAEKHPNNLRLEVWQRALARGASFVGAPQTKAPGVGGRRGHYEGFLTIHEAVGAPFVIFTKP
ncbi:hypothetical protein M2A_1281 [Tepidicaulis marinus]|uniref:Uncharacterized protein n=1 Tax=Tepidicaulis marinus TaxID=1333998 RepID=A0A081B9R4_9HYPH|nr:hypothetical protein M2A_1281 [Tepidicaulis marinus]